MTIFPPEFAGLDRYGPRELSQHVHTGNLAPTRGLEAFYNRFRGERCFVIGNGPSLNSHDLSLLDGEYSFGVNSIYYKTEETGFRPTFFVVEDDAVMRENLDKIRAYRTPYRFFSSTYRELIGESEGTFFFRANRGYYEKSSPNFCVPRFSTDMTRELFCGQSVTFINLQIAFFMGFTEVYLIGMDFSYQVPKEHERKGDLIFSTTDDPNHFHKDYFGKGKTWKDPKLDRVEISYRQAKLVYEAVGRKIYNATIGGHLELFDRVDYDGLFDPAAPKRAIMTDPLPAAGSNTYTPRSPLKARLASWLRDTSPPLFSAARGTVRALRNLRRH